MSILMRSDENAVARLVLNAPKKLNALSDEMLAELQSALDDIKKDASVRAVVLSGAGKAFCAGHDIKEMQAGRQSSDGGRAYFRDLFDRCSKVMLSIRALPQPVIAQVHGIAAAAGCQLVATCDLAVAEENTQFGVNGVNIGLFCSTPMVALSRNVPAKKAFEMLTTGDFLSTREAQDLGLINRVAPTGQLDAVTTELAQKLAKKLSSAVKIGKEAFYNQIEMPIEAAYDYTRDVMVENLDMRDTAEGMAAFIEKRAPDWAE